MPSCDQTGTFHFHSSTTPGSASLIRLRRRRNSLPRQPPSSATRSSNRSSNVFPSFGVLFRIAWLGSCSKLVKARRIVHENALADAGIGFPHRKLVEELAVIDLEQGRDVGRLPARWRDRIRVRPIGSPDDAVRVRS